MAVFTNDDLKTIGAFDQAQGSTTDQLRLLRGIANRVGLYDAADALIKMIVDASPAVIAAEAEAREALDAAFPNALSAEIEGDTLVALFNELEKLSTGQIVTLDTETSDRFADVVAGIEDHEQAIGFVRRIMVDLRVLPAYTPKVIALSDKLSRVMLDVL